MKSFSQFLQEDSHEVYGHYAYDWGVIHPHTGELISGHNHPGARSHRDFKNILHQKDPNIPQSHYAEYLHTSGHKNNSGFEDNGSSVHVRTRSKESKQGLKKGLKNLPIANNYTHNNIHFNDVKKFHSSINEDSPDAPYGAPPSFTGLDKNPYQIPGNFGGDDRVPPEKDKLTNDPGGDKLEGAFEMTPSDEVEQDPSNLTVAKKPFVGSSVYK